MTWEVAGGVYLAVLLGLLLGGVWVSIAIGMTGVVGLLIVNPALLAGIESTVWNTLDSFVLTAVPLFLFMGSMVLNSGISTRFYRGLSPWLAGVPGGLAQSNIAACSIFAAVSGSSVATAAAIGAIAIPEMRERGYDMQVTTGTLAAGGTLGILIPPSISMIVYGSVVGESIGRLFAAGVVPGIMLSLGFMAFIWVQAQLRPDIAPRHTETVTWGARWRGLLDTVPILLLIVLVLGGLYAGIMTPTEAGGVGAVGAIAVAALYRRLTWSAVHESLVDTLRTNSMVLFIIVGAQVMSFALVSANIPRGIVGAIAALSISPGVIFSAIVAMYVVLGCLVEALSLMLLTLPVVYPIIQAQGFDPIWFGVILVILLETGLITPPVGLNLYVIQGMAKVPLGVVARGAFPYAVMMVLAVAVLWFLPGLALWLPDRLF
jgi:tripartite ATP-independent transporter DctM subunit